MSKDDVQYIIDNADAATAPLDNETSFDKIRGEAIELVERFKNAYPTNLIEMIDHAILATAGVSKKHSEDVVGPEQLEYFGMTLVDTIVAIYPEEHQVVVEHTYCENMAANRIYDEISPMHYTLSKEGSVHEILRTLFSDFRSIQTYRSILTGEDQYEQCALVYAHLLIGYKVHRIPHSVVYDEEFRNSFIDKIIEEANELQSDITVHYSYNLFDDETYGVDEEDENDYDEVPL